VRYGSSNCRGHVGRRDVEPASLRPGSRRSAGSSHGGSGGERFLPAVALQLRELLGRQRCREARYDDGDDGAHGRAERRGGIRIRRVERKPFAEALEGRSEEHTSELQSRENLVCRLLLEKKK